MAAVVGLEDIKRARPSIDGVTAHTPVLSAGAISRWTGAGGAAQSREPAAHGLLQAARRVNRMATLSTRERARGVVAASAGNHAQGVALAATALGVSVARLHAGRRPARQAGRDGRLRRRGRARGRDVRGELRGGAPDPDGRLLVPPFDDPAIIAGQGTIGLELLEQTPDADTVVVPLGGGGLLSGIAIAVKALRPDIRVIGVQAAGCASWTPRSRPGTPSTSSASRRSPTASRCSAPAISRSRSSSSS